jgi:hypothetical protein
MTQIKLPPKFAALFLTLFAWGAWQTDLHAQVVINEVLADNRSAVLNGGNFPDYIELHNPTASPVSIAGWSLTDDALLPQKYIFPGGTSVPANGYLIVWADLNFGSPGLHTGFGLGAKGDLLRLYAADGFTLRDEIVFGLQVGDVSLGRVPDGVGTWTANQPSAGSANTAIPLGAGNQLRINEWMARPTTGDDWIEVFNSAEQPIALGGAVLTDQAVGVPGNRAIPAHSYIAGRGYVQFFASDLAQPDADHLDYKLSSDGETLTIYAPDRTTIWERVVFGPQTQNVSQGRAPDGSDNFVFFAGSSITPGASNFRLLTNIVVSEVLSHTDPPLEDAIELQNLTGAPVDISHWWLSDSGSTPRKYRVPTSTVIPAHGFKVFYHVQFGAGPTGFALDSAEGDEVFLSAGDAAGNLTGEQTFVRFGALKNGIAVGRHQTSVGLDFVPLSQRTFGADNPATVTQFRLGTGLTNAAPRVASIVINEIMFYPPDVGGQANTDDEFIELHNPTAFAVPLYDQLFPTNTWRLRDGISFDFPQNLTLAAGGYLLLVSFDPVMNPAKLSAFRSTYSVPANVLVLGPYTGKLNDAGESVEMLEPDAPQGPLTSNPGFVPYMQTEKIKYAIAAPWPANAANTGRSLQRRVASSYGNEPLNWGIGNPTAGRTNVIDSDGDGLPDSWEEQYQLNPNSALDAALDSDLDGATNWQEFQVGTNPKNSASVFAITNARVQGSAIILRFPNVAGRTYSIQARDSLTTATWQTITNLPVVGNTGDREVQISVLSNPRRFFRLTTPTTP